MKRKILSLLLVMSMVATLFVGCGESETKDNGTTQNSEKETTDKDVAQDSEKETTDQDITQDGGNDELDANISYVEGEVITAGGKKVKLYSDPAIVDSWENDPDIQVFIYAYDKNDDVYGFSAHDASSAEAYIDSFLQGNDHMEIKEQEKLQIGGRTIHAFHFKEKETGREYGSFGVIELGSDVVFTFSYKHVNFGDPAFEDLLGATKFIVE